MVAEHLSVQEVEGIRGDFDTIDTRNKGKVDIEELRVGLNKLGHQVNEADVKNLMETVSTIMFTWPYIHKYNFEIYIIGLNKTFYRVVLGCLF